LKGGRKVERWFI